MEDDKTRPYRTYLPRCWREGKALLGQEAVCRFSLEEVGREQRRHGFGDLQELGVFLHVELMSAASESGQQEE